MHSVDTAPVEIPKDRRRWTQIVDSIKKAIFILGTTCVFIIAASNSITW